MAKSVTTQKPKQPNEVAVKKSVSIPPSTATQPHSGDVQSQLATMCSSLLRNEQTLLQMLQNQIQQQTVSREGLASFFSCYHLVSVVSIYYIFMTRCLFFEPEARSWDWFSQFYGLLVDVQTEKYCTFVYNNKCYANLYFVSSLSTICKCP